MTGLVLCGGESLRMGTDKGLMINTKKVTWAQQSFSLLSKLEIPVILSLNKKQKNHYKRVFPMQELILDNAEMQIKGPLLGILSAHLKHPTEDLFVLACDMGEMQLQVLNFFYKYYQEHTDKDAYVFEDNNIAEPLCAIYRQEGLLKLYNLYKKGVLKKHSLQYCLEQINTERIPLPADWKNYFSNFNTPKDLQSF